MYTTVLYILTSSAAISAQNTFQRLILGYIYRYTSCLRALPFPCNASSVSNSVLLRESEGSQQSLYILFHMTMTCVLSRLRSSTSRLLDVHPSLSVTAHCLLLDHGSGTACLKTSSLPRHWQCFADNWNVTSFGNHIRTLFCSCIATVDLELTLRRPL